MHTQISFAPAIGNLCRISSTSNDFPQSLCRSVYPWRLNKKHNYWEWVSTKCHSTRKLRAYLDKNLQKNKGPKNNSYPSLKFQLDWDPFEDLFGVGIDMEPRNITFSRPEPRSWFGPNGQYVKELPCPSCRGRGYMLCTECGIHRSSPSCLQCHGKGLRTCRQCLGECVIWEESVDELPWEKARTSSPINIVEDDAIDKMEIELVPKRKSKRVYASTPPDVGAKISRTLRNLNAVTGMFSKRMKKVHSDPVLHAQRVEAMKRAKRTPAARKHMSKKLKSFFSNPENRLKRSLSMKGVKFYCQNCGQEGHRSHYCPSLKDTIGQSWYTCSICGESGHNRTTCKRKKENKKPQSQGRVYNCVICGQADHNCNACPQNDQVKIPSSQHKDKKCRTPRSADLPNNENVVSRRTIKCSVCCTEDHNARLLIWGEA